MARDTRCEEVVTTTNERAGTSMKEQSLFELMIKPGRICEFVVNSLAENFYTELNYQFNQDVRKLTWESAALLEYMISCLIEKYYPKNVRHVQNRYRTPFKKVEITGNNFIVPNRHQPYGFIIISITQLDYSDPNVQSRAYKIIFVGKKHDLYADRFNSKFLKSLNEIQRLWSENEEIYIHRLLSPGGSMSASIAMPKRSVESVFIDKKEKRTLIERLDQFMSPRTKKFYREIQEPYHYNILLYGTPGTGKNSIVYMIASRYSMPILRVQHSVVLSEKNGFSLMDALNGINNYIILIDEIDVMLPHRSKLEAKQQPFFEEMLNFLDCIADKNIVIACTNHIENLDPALVRSGRFNQKIELKNWDRSLLEDALSYHNVTLEELDTFYPVLNIERDFYVPAEVMDAIRQIKLNRLSESPS